MSQRVKLPKIDPGVTVDIADPESGTEHHFKMIPITLEVEEQIEELQKETTAVENNPDSTPVDRMEVQVKQLDIVLVPVERPAGDKFEEKTPTELLIPGYKDGKVTATQIRALVQNIVERSRPI
jgi:hypothetical protein